MQEAIGLTGAIVDGHATFDEVFPNLGDFDPDVFGHGVPAQWLDTVSG
jgi:hypothetical protein